MSPKQPNNKTRFTMRRVFEWAMSHPRLQNDLLFIASAYNLEELPERGIVFLGNHEKVAAQGPRNLERSIFAFRLEDIDRGFGILVLRCGQTAKFPSERQFNGDYVRLFVGVLEIDSVVARGMVKNLFFRRGEKPDRHQRPFSGACNPT